MTFAIIQLFIFQLVLPAVFIFTLWKGRYNSKLHWLIQALFAIMYITWTFFSGRWDWLGYYLRFIWLILLVLTLFRSWVHAKQLPFRVPTRTKNKFSLGFEMLIMLVFALYNVFVLNSYFTKDEAIQLSFPLKDGAYYIAHGGSNEMMNYHNTHEPQQYALDISKLNKFGTRANGLYPKSLEKYEIYGETLYSPCTGEVLETRNDLPNLIPPEADPEHATGNYVVLSCENVVIYIAHMKQNSVKVSEGEMIQEGQQIGLVGNSGNTSEPHLHIHAERDGVGIPMQFDGKFMVRNQLVWDKP